MKKLLSLFIILSISLLVGCTKKSDIEMVYQGSPEETNLTKTTVMSDFDQTTIPEKGEQIIVMETSMGDIKLRLFPDFAPKTVENFVGLADKGYYDGLTFHRVMDDFMIQGGDPLGNGTGGESLWGKKFEDEFSPNLKNLRGALSMANAGPNTNGSQFFIVQKEGGTAWLNGAHTVFGQVIDGMDVVDDIAEVDVDAASKPLEDVVMEKVTVETF